MLTLEGGTSGDAPGSDDGGDDEDAKVEHILQQALASAPEPAGGVWTAVDPAQIATGLLRTLIRPSFKLLAFAFQHHNLN